jgi:NAD(P)-dependent dehydrogenase (short-subunit alcohol dehydrogenase family)
MTELAGKVAVITGSTRGIGLAMAQLFAEEGARLVINGRKRDALDQAREMVPGAIGIEGSVSDPRVVNSMVAAALEHFGHLDVAVANAASPNKPARVSEMEDDVWQRCIQTNLSGAFYLVRAAGQVMADEGTGSIILVGSIAGTRGLSTQAAYSASKGGLVGLVAAAAKDLGPAGVRVNLLLPSAVTRQTDAGWSREELSNLSPFKRTGDPREVAQLALFLGSDRSSFVTGETINVDGGIHINWGEL